jgi:hypothetical protein
VNDTDVDGDAVQDATDNCPTVRNPGQADGDQDGIGNVCDAPSPPVDGGGGGDGGGTGVTGGTGDTGDTSSSSATTATASPSGESAPPPPPATVVTPLPRAGRVAANFKLVGTRTVIKALTVRGLAHGAVIKITCQTKGCPFKSKRLASSRSMSLAKLFKNNRLAAGTKIEIVVTAPGATTVRVAFKLRAKKPPVRSG